jgi:hypothetical protein
MMCWQGALQGFAAPGVAWLRLAEMIAIRRCIIISHEVIDMIPTAK